MRLTIFLKESVSTKKLRTMAIRSLYASLLIYNSGKIRIRKQELRASPVMFFISIPLLNVTNFGTRTCYIERASTFPYCIIFATFLSIKLAHSDKAISSSPTSLIMVLRVTSACVRLLTSRLRHKIQETKQLDFWYAY